MNDKRKEKKKNSKNLRAAGLSVARIERMSLKDRVIIGSGARFASDFWRLLPACLPAKGYSITKI